MQIVIPLSGMGKRFLAAGYTVPKPLISIEGKPMIAHVVDLFPGEKDIIFICNEGHIKHTNLKRILKKLCPTAKIKVTPYRGLGPVEAVLTAEDLINDKKPVVVNYCDFSMIWDYKQFKKEMRKGSYDGAVICYKGFHPHLLGNDLYAGVKTDENNILLEIREKYSYTPNKMETWQSAGTYYFKNGKILKKYFRETIKNNLQVNNEYYVSVVYNLLQKDGLQSVVYPIDYFLQWGTPQDLQTYLYWSAYFHSKIKHDKAKR